jgi:hypothetical protein
MASVGKGQQPIADFFKKSQPWVSKNLLGKGPLIDHLDTLARLTGHDPGDFVTWREVDFVQSDLASPGVGTEDTDRAEAQRGEGERRSVLEEPYFSCGLTIRGIFADDKDGAWAFHRELPSILADWRAKHRAASGQ